MLVPGILGSIIFVITRPDSEILYALILAPLIAFANAVIGLALIRKGMRSSQSLFFKLVFGGMGIRLLVLGGIIALIYSLRLLHFLTFLVALLAYYVAFMIVEILYVQIHMSTEGTTQESGSEGGQVDGE